MQKAAIYARVSTDRQEEQRTIESQLAELRKVCASAEVHVVREYVDDGYSGTTLDRPGLDQVRDDASRGAFQVLYILSPDRLSRKYAYQILVLEELRRHDIQVIFMNRPVTDRPDDQLLFGIQGIIAEYERAQIIDRTRRGQLYKARQGAFVGGKGPYGYGYVPGSTGSPAHLKVNEPQAEVVRLIFSLYLNQHKSTTGVARELIARGIKTREGLKHWRPNVVYRMLRNEAYAGTAYYNKCIGHGNGKKRDRSEWIPLKTPTIIDRETFDLAQQTLSSRRRTEIKGGHSGHVYILSGLLWCGHCGCRYSGFSRPQPYKHYYYRCINFAKTRPFPRTCQARAVRSNRIEPAIVNALRDMLLRPRILRDHLVNINSRIQKGARGAGKRRERLDGLRALLEQKQQKLLDLCLDGTISRDEYLKKKEDLEEQVRKVDAAAAMANQELPSIDETTIERSVEQFAEVARKNLENMSPGQMNTFLRSLLIRATYDWKETEVELRGHVPVVYRNHALLHSPHGLLEEKSNNTLEFEMTIKV